MVHNFRMTMIRTFHPVGQGAFYSEQFRSENGDGFRIVYDCGTKTSKEKVDPVKVIQDAFKDSKPIDILFISHFDKDHVSMISELLNQHAIIKRVVLPLLPVEETAVLQAHYRHEGNTIGEHLLADPVGFFHNKAAILRVESTRNEPIELSLNHAEVPRDIPHDSDVVILKPDGELVDAKSGDRKDIPSGARIFVPRHSWCYILHNHEYLERHRVLSNALAKRADIDQTRLGEASYIDEKSKELNEVYRLLEAAQCGNINENSMLVYSGPSRCPLDMTHVWGELIWSGCEFNCGFEDRPACIYSGDSDFNKVKIHEVYKEVWENVGIVQIPHHGSGRSFSAEFLGKSDSVYICPISAGQHNQHHHPAPTVLKDIQIRHSLPLIVDECPCSKLTQHIWLH